MKREVLIYESEDGRCPYLFWLNSLNDIRGRAIVRARIERIRLGNPGDCKCLSGGVFELRIQFGPGYRVYFGQEGQNIVVLLCGGNKSSQKRDIFQARILWGEYKNAAKKLPG